MLGSLHSPISPSGEPNPHKLEKTMRLAPSLLAIIALLAGSFLQGQSVTTFEGMNASGISQPSFEVDHNGSVGTKQYLEWVNDFYQAYNKTTFAPVWSTPQTGDHPWRVSKLTNCYGSGGGEGTVTFDRLASRWVIARRASPAAYTYAYCIAVSNTDDLSSTSLAWYTYEFNITAALGTNADGYTFYPDWPRFGVWSDGYYATFDLEDPQVGYQETGVVVCAFDRTDMLAHATADTPQCFSNPDPMPLPESLYLAHSLIPADIDGMTAPPSGEPEYLVSIENPSGKATKSTSINLWSFHVDWTAPGKSTFKKAKVTVPSYEPGCYSANNPADTFCVAEPSTASTGNYVDSVGDRLMPRFAYRNFGTYQSWLVSHTIQVGTAKTQQTGVRWYEFRGTTPALYQSGTVSDSSDLFLFVPSMAQDGAGNAVLGYSVSSPTVHPGIRASYWSLGTSSTPTEIVIQSGTGDEENSSLWGNITSLTVDPTDNCTFWYVNRYYLANQTGNEMNWDTRIGNFKLATCN
jgi:hypothetical protein